jgi:hypothetical protein
MNLWPRYCPEHGRRWRGKYCRVCGKQLKLTGKISAIVLVIVSVVGIIAFSISFPIYYHFHKMALAEERMDPCWRSLHQALREAPAGSEKEVIDNFLDRNKSAIDNVVAPLTPEELNWMVWDVSEHEDYVVKKLSPFMVRNPNAYPPRH